MMCDSVVLPRPGGPNSSTWSSASERFLAAPMKISSCSRVLAWPTYSASNLGRSARSMASSLGDAGAADTTRGGVGGMAKSSVLIVIGGSPRQRLQRQLDAFADAHVLGQWLERGLRFLVAVPEGDQRLQDVGLRIGGRAGAGRRTKVGADLALQFEQEALGGLLADAGHLDQAGRILRRHG